MKFTKYISVISALVVSATLFSACGKNNNATDLEDESIIFTEEKNPTYGEKIYDNRNNDIELEYDPVFVTDDMAKVVSDYFYGIQSQDVNMYKSSTIDFYQQYLIDGVYAEKKYDDVTFLKALYNGIANDTGDGFVIEKITVTDFYNSQEAGLDNIYDLLDDLSDEKDFSDSIQDGCGLTLSLTVMANDEEFDTSDQHIYLIKYDDKYHIVTA